MIINFKEVYTHLNIYINITAPTVLNTDGGGSFGAGSMGTFYSNKTGEVFLSLSV
jgi:hypothetical protein